MTEIWCSSLSEKMGWVVATLCFCDMILRRAEYSVLRLVRPIGCGESLSEAAKIAFQHKKRRWNSHECPAPFSLFH